MDSPSTGVGRYAMRPVVAPTMALENQMFKSRAGAINKYALQVFTHWPDPNVSEADQVPVVLEHEWSGYFMGFIFGHFFVQRGSDQFFVMMKRDAVVNRARDGQPLSVESGLMPSNAIE